HEECMPASTQSHITSPCAQCLYQFLPPDSREFEDLVKILSSFYLDASSRGTFTYCKARLIHNELLEKEFIEKRREMKQEGRTEQELAESYCFLYPDKSKLQWICEKGLSVGHSRITTLGNPATGVYLSKFSDLLQINPFEVGSFGDMIVFKVMRGHLKHIYENMPKNAMEPTPKFDCHVSKSANRVTSLLSYRAFELTQQYFFEFAFDEIKARPRHVRPYAVVSFQYKGKEAASAPMTAHRCVFFMGEIYLLSIRFLTVMSVFSASASRPYEPESLSVEPQPAILSSLEPFVPALHYALLKLRPNPGKDLSSGVERQAHDYLTRMESATVRPFILPEYKQNLDERSNLHPAPRPKYNMENLLRTYVHSPTTYILSLTKAKDMIERIQNPVPPPAPAPVEYSPVSDWGGSDRGSDRAERPQSQRLRLSQNEYDKDKMKQLLKLIQLHKKDGTWDTHSLKRKLEGEDRGGMNKHQRTEPLSNGEPSRGEEGLSLSDGLCVCMCPSQSKSGAVSHSRKMGTVKDKASTKTKTEASSTEQGGEIYSPSQVTTDSPESNSTQNPSPNPGSAPAPGSNLLANSLIGQLKPEVFSSLVEIFKDVTKNTVKFYIYSGDEGDERTVCKEIKEYLISLGNSECNPQTFLENSSSLDKLLIIIQNEDIAAHVHKIPALVSLKKLSSVSFAGVDTLDDVKNHTYNELFVSGGFMVSDEFVLNPDLITQDRLQGLLKFLEEQSTPEHPWQWKVHCKSQKKLKELGRLNTNAMGLLNLLTAYQKKHLVEFLPYHECDTQSRQAPDLDCLIKLQAQHTQQRHLIFLTERPFEMFLQYSRNGIVIASIDDIMSGFHSLIGSINQNELPTPPSTGE
uniref:Transcription activation suppressor b n=1 Tax=Myripristis murdjan TaxID=586833 RepID=A0A667ZX75_9TELE